jgi:hypothetical protein
VGPEVEARSSLTGGEGGGSGKGGAKTRSPEVGGRKGDGRGLTRWKSPLHFRELVGGRGRGGEGWGGEDGGLTGRKPHLHSRERVRAGMEMKNLGIYISNIVAALTTQL